MIANAAALVLAGGQSRRMGHDKALLSLPTDNAEKQPTLLLQNACNVAQACGFRTYVLTPWPERYIGLLPESIVLLKEQRCGAGPLVALAQGWPMICTDGRNRSECVPDWLLVLACDMPALNTLTIQTWQRRLEKADENEIAALPRQNNRWEPLCGFYHRRCLPSLQTAVASNVGSFQRWLANEPVMSLSVANSNMLQNCNTPAEWQHFLNSTEARNP